MTKTQKIIWQVLEKAECWQNNRLPTDHVTKPCVVSCIYYKERKDITYRKEYKCTLVSRLANTIDKAKRSR